MNTRLKVNGVLVSILEGLGDACLLVDDAGRIVFANERTKDLFPIPKSLRNIHLRDVIADGGILGLLEHVLLTGQGVEREFPVQLKINSRLEDRYLAVNAMPIDIGGSGGRYMRVLVKDQTERHATDQVRKDFVANASHELRTPLSIINGYLENLVDGVVSDPVQLKKCLLTMRKHGERIARIVEDMLTLSKFESALDEEGPHVLRQGTFSCSDCVGDVLERVASLIESKQAKITLKIDREADQIAGDRFYWDQIFFNLIENALKENEVGIEVEICGERIGRSVILQVQDNGIGIPREDLPFVFKRFYRVAKHHSQQIKGTGLGLSIVRRAVEAHGGSITVESTVGVKTSFIMEIPDVEMLQETAIVYPLISKVQRD